MRNKMFQNLYPSEDYDSAYQIDYEGFYDKGYRGILFDVDNTLVEHDQPVTLPAIELFENLKEMGFKTCIISNNKDYRVKPLADALESEYVYKAGKPSKAGYEKGMEIMGTNRENTVTDFSAFKHFVCNYRNNGRFIAICNRFYFPCFLNYSGKNFNHFFLFLTI